MRKKLHVVFCVDTEGPLYESPQALCTRLKYHFDIDVRPDIESFAALRASHGVRPEIRDAVKQMLDPRLTTCYGSWDAIREMLDRVTSPDFRNTWRDSQGNGLAYSWFCLDHVGYEENPRRRAMGYHSVFDFYRDYLVKDCDLRDTFQFHYHPLPYNKKANSCATYYLNGNHLTTILARRIIDRAWFPCANRPGFHTLRPDSHWFLEQWLPFDYANQACEDADSGDLTQGQFGDWRRAPRLWGGYNPSHDDYQVAGSCRRWIFRCLNAHARLRTVTVKDVDEACLHAQENGIAVLAVTDHDFRDMERAITPFYTMVQEAASRHGLDLCFSNAETAARDYIGLSVQTPGLSIGISQLDSEQTHVLQVCSSSGIFGPQPFLALKTVDGHYFYDNFDFDAATPGRKWSYVFSWQTFPLKAIECLGVASASPSGAVDVLRYWPETGREERVSHYMH